MQYPRSPGLLGFVGTPGGPWKPCPFPLSLLPLSSSGFQSHPCTALWCVFRFTRQILLSASPRPTGTVGSIDDKMVKCVQVRKRLVTEGAGEHQGEVGVDIALAFATRLAPTEASACLFFVMSSQLEQCPIFHLGSFVQAAMISDTAIKIFKHSPRRGMKATGNYLFKKFCFGIAKPEFKGLERVSGWFLMSFPTDTTY